MSRNSKSSIARDYCDRRRDENNPLPGLIETLGMVREAQLVAAETVRAEAVRFLEYCLTVEVDVAMRMIEDVVSERRKEF